MSTHVSFITCQWGAFGLAVEPEIVVLHGYQHLINSREMVSFNLFIAWKGHYNWVFQLFQPDAKLNYYNSIDYNIKWHQINNVVLKEINGIKHHRNIGITIYTPICSDSNEFNQTQNFWFEFKNYFQNVNKFKIKFELSPYKTGFDPIQNLKMKQHLDQTQTWSKIRKNINLYLYNVMW